MKTHVIFLLDESGSMSDTASDVRGGFNTYIEKLRSDGNDYTLTAIKFGATVRPLWADLPLEQVPGLSVENYMPCDSTALYDAIGHGFAVAAQWRTEEKPYGEDRVLFLIMTDGLENSSRTFKKEEIVAKIKRREVAGNWTFVYLGADQDAWSVASNLGFASGNVLSYAKTSTNTAFTRLATSTEVACASAGEQTFNFFDDSSGEE